MPSRLQTWKPPRMKVESTRELRHYTTKAWAEKRRRILVRDACVCQACGSIASGPEAHVDHIVPLADGGADDDGNLQTLCRPCHSKKTIGEQRRKGNLGH